MGYSPGDHKRVGRDLATKQKQQQQQLIRTEEWHFILGDLEAESEATTKIMKFHRTLFCIKSPCKYYIIIIIYFVLLYKYTVLSTLM